MPKKNQHLNGKTPAWFKEWHYEHFQEVDARSKRNEKLIYAILGSVVVLNTVGNWYHLEIIEFFCRLFGVE